MRETWRNLTAAVAVIAGSAVFLLVWPTGFQSLRLLGAGSLLASAFWMPFLFIVLRTYAATVGAWGEDYARDMLKKHAKQWPVLHDLPLENRNVDHVAISPTAVMVVETKLRGGNGPPRSAHLRDLDQVRRNARP